MCHHIFVFCLFLLLLVKISVQDGIPKCKTSSNSDSADSTECSSDDKSFQGYDSVFYQNAYKSEDSAKQFAKQLSRYMMPADDGDDGSGGMFGNVQVPASVVDIGCGAGLLVKNLRNLGLESHCLEGSPEASAHWPTTQDNYSHTYHIVNLLTDQAREVMPVTDYVVSFEVAEHIKPYDTDKFIALLTMHKPKRIIFGAATVDQDRGLNPTHVNEREFDYWIMQDMQLI